MENCLNKLTEEQLAEVTGFAELLFTPREIAQMLELQADAFVDECNQEGTAAYRAFYSGRFQAEVELRKSILKMSKAGSTPAQTMAVEMLKKSATKMIDR